MCIYICIYVNTKYLYMYKYICMHICTLNGLSPMLPTRALNASRPPDQLQVTSGAPWNQQRDQSIVQARSCVEWTWRVPRVSFGGLQGLR